MQPKPFRNERVKKNLAANRTVGDLVLKEDLWRARCGLRRRLALLPGRSCPRVHFSGRRNASFRRAVSRLMRSITRRAHTNSAASKPKPIKITGVPGPGVKII